MAIFVLEALDLDEILEAAEAFVVEPFGVGPSAVVVVGIVAEEAVPGIVVVVEEADLETAVVADPGIVEEVEADSGTVAAVDIVVD